MTGQGAYAIRGKELAIGRELEIGSALGDSSSPAISGHWVVWLSHTGDAWSIQARDIAAMSDPVTLVRRVGQAHFSTQPPRIAGDRIGWLESVDDTTRIKTTWNWQLFTCQVSNCTATVAAEGKQSSFVPGTYDIGGDVAVTMRTMRD